MSPKVKACTLIALALSLVFCGLATADETDLIWSTFLGGSGDDYGYGIALDELGNAYVSGETWSYGFPTTAGAFDETHNGFWDVFVAKLGGELLPVVLASFQATGGQGFIALGWVTASEINCHRWEVYRGQQEDGEYAKIGDLPGYGSTESEHTYRWVDRRVNPGKTYFYKLKQLDFDGSAWWSHSVSATAVATVPETYALHQNYPNPFNANTQIHYQIPKEGYVTLKIFNIRGQEVRSLVDADQEANWHAVLWDGRDNRGREVASGLYFCRLKAWKFSKTIKMALLK